MELDGSMCSTGNTCEGREMMIKPVDGRLKAEGRRKKEEGRRKKEKIRLGCVVPAERRLEGARHQSSHTGPCWLLLYRAYLAGASLD